ncbi:MAG: hypothetical protein Pars2KO_25440 [Parasphingorhabdus sp.]
MVRRQKYSMQAMDCTLSGRESSHGTKSAMGAKANIRNAEAAGQISAPVSDISMRTALSRKRTLGFSI